MGYSRGVPVQSPCRVLVIVLSDFLERFVTSWTFLDAYTSHIALYTLFSVLLTIPIHYIYKYNAYKWVCPQENTTRAGTLRFLLILWIVPSLEAPSLENPQQRIPTHSNLLH